VSLGADGDLSAAERALENQPLGARQIRVAVICGLIQMCDGYDLASIGWAAPSLTHAWQLAPSSFALAFLCSNLGILLGAFVVGPLGDRLGRKPLLLISLGLIGGASLVSAVPPSPGFLAGTRFFTGVGIAGGFAGAVASTGNYAPRHRRATMIMLTFTGGPLGSFVGGVATSYLLYLGFGWQIIFVIGGVFPLLLLAVCGLWLPESPPLVATEASDAVQGNPLVMLFSGRYASRTMLLWIGFFAACATFICSPIGCRRSSIWRA
jgi:AAHS family 4-hydroxybenzoate transporter-like MFS transporter